MVHHKKTVYDELGNPCEVILPLEDFEKLLNSITEEKLKPETKKQPFNPSKLRNIQKNSKLKLFC